MNVTSWLGGHKHGAKAAVQSRTGPPSLDTLDENPPQCGESFSQRTTIGCLEGGFELVPRVSIRTEQFWGELTL